MTDRVFLDSNLWVYVQGNQDPEKAQIVQKIVEGQSQSILVSTQNLGELFYVLTRKKLTSKAEAEAIVIDLTQNFPILAIDAQTVLKALEISDRYTFSYWDSLILATALLNDCSIFYSEDMQHNQLIESRLSIVNPFQ
jgi:predicted nucleic acid-binding protein